MPLLERRVAKEAFNCLTGYAAASNGRYPWAATNTLSAAGDYSDQQDARFGRLPDSFSSSLLGLISPSDPVLAPIVGSVCGLLPAACMSNSWPPATATPPCHIAVGSWWLNWKEVVFYGVADAYKPAATVQVLPPSVSVPAPGGCGNCLTVDPPSGADNKRFVVVVSGKRLSAVAGGQPRSSTANKGNPANYLEDANGDPAPPGTSQNFYTQQSTTATFNDVLLFRQ